MVSYEEARRWVVNNKLKAVGSLWAAGLAISLAYQVRAGVEEGWKSHASPSLSPQYRQLVNHDSLLCPYQWTRPIPTQLKLIHSRVYAQALTLGALGLVAVAQPAPARRPGPAGRWGRTTTRRNSTEGSLKPRPRAVQTDPNWALNLATIP